MQPNSNRGQNHRGNRQGSAGCGPIIRQGTLNVRFIHNTHVFILISRFMIYADFALKNPFYSLEMPIRADLFEEHLQVAIDQIERTGFI